MGKSLLTYIPRTKVYDDGSLGAVDEVDCVQESVFESYPSKKEIFKKLDRLAGCDTILASSTSGLLISRIQRIVSKPQKCIIAHPWNSVHLIPLVEIVPGIDMKRPLHGNLAVQAIIQSKGLATTVSDSEMLKAASLLAKTEGIFAEPASASTIASLSNLVRNGEIDSGEETVCVITGMGLKDPSSVRKVIERRKHVERLLERAGERTITTGITGTKLRILQVLSERESYGYGLWKLLRERFQLHLSLPSVYQHLYELETMKLVERGKIGKPSTKRERYYYALTEKGKIILKGSVAVR